MKSSINGRFTGVEKDVVAVTWNDWVGGWCLRLFVLIAAEVH